MHAVRWSVGWAAGLPGAVPRSCVCFYCRGNAASLHLVSVSLGTYSCYDYEQSLIKLQRIIPRNHRVCVGGWVVEWVSECTPKCEDVWAIFFVCFFLGWPAHSCMLVFGWLVHIATVSLPQWLFEAPRCLHCFLCVVPLTPNYPSHDRFGQCVRVYASFFLSFFLSLHHKLDNDGFRC